MDNRKLYHAYIPEPIIDLLDMISEHNRETIPRGALAKEWFQYGYGIRREHLLYCTRDVDNMSDADRFAFNEIHTALMQSFALLAASKKMSMKGSLVLNAAPIMITASEIVRDEIAAAGRKKPTIASVMSDLITHGAVYLYHKQWTGNHNPYDLITTAYKNNMNARLQSAITMLVDTAPGREIPRTIEEYKEREAEISNRLSKQARGIFDDIEKMFEASAKLAPIQELR